MKLTQATGQGGAPAGATRPSNAADDRLLMVRVTTGDAAALEALYTRYGRPCFALARRIVIDNEFAEDVVQEVFLALWNNPEKYDPGHGAFSSWLLSVTHHKAVDRVRREETLRKRRTNLDDLEGVASTLTAVDEQVWSSVRGEQVRAAMLTLSEVQRTTLELAYFGGHTQTEIAALTDTPLGTVKTRMLAGMKKLRESQESISDSAINAADGLAPATTRPSERRSP